VKDFAVCLLAAGKGARAGGPKALVMRDGKTLLAKQLEFLGGLFAKNDIRFSIQAGWEFPGGTVVDPDASPLASLQALLGSKPAFVYHVDMPLWEKGLFEALARAYQGEPLVPVHDGRRGHPVLLSPRAQAEILKLDPKTGRLDHFLKGSATLEVPYACIHENRNTLHELQA
jgi:CTP:molybdopterin cytidylyltransferase MocA